MKAGELVKFVCAPPRWTGDRRSPGRLLGKTGVVVEYLYEDSHDWGGVWDLIVEGNVIQYWGDFLEVVTNEGR